MGGYVAIAVILLFFVAMVIGFIAGIVISLTGGDGSGLAWSCGLPLMAAIISSVNSRKGG